MSRTDLLLPAIALLVLELTAGALVADERLLVHAQINGHPVVLALDTGAEETAIFKRTAKRLNLKLTAPPADTKSIPGKLTVSRTEPCTLLLGNMKVPDLELAVAEAPAFVNLQIDGVLGWWNVKNQIIAIDADSKSGFVLPQLPKDIAEWTQWNLRRDSRILELQLPGQPAEFVPIDTGSDSGIGLGEARWRKWEKQNTDSPATMRAYVNLHSGVVASRMYWARKFDLGGLSLPDVPVYPMDHFWNLNKPNRTAVLGLFALTRLQLVIDGRNNAIYTRPKARPKSKYPYNRMAAVFVPKNKKSNDLVAHVIENGPAHKAGVRNGDVLTKIGRVDVTRWRTTPGILPLGRFWSFDAGIKLDLELRRNDKTIKVNVELTEIFERAQGE